MKTLIKSLVLIVAFVFSTQAMSQVSEEIKQIQDIWGIEKKEMVKQYMDLPVDQAEAFWEVYNEYAEARKALGNDRINLIIEYAEKYTSLTDEMATDMTKRLFANNIAVEKLQLKYFNKLSKVVSPLEASKFFQMEKYLETILRLNVQDNIPFIGELDELRGS